MSELAELFSEFGSKIQQMDNAKDQEIATLRQENATLRQQLASKSNSKWCVEIGLNENTPMILNAYIQGKPESAEIIANQKKEKEKKQQKEYNARNRIVCGCGGISSTREESAVKRNHDGSAMHKKWVAEKLAEAYNY